MQTAIDYLLANTVMVGLLVGAVTPALTSVVQQPRWSKRTRTFASVGVSVVLGFVTAASTGAITDVGQLVPTVVAVLMASEAAYRKLWKITGTATAIEIATSRAAPTPAEVVESRAVPTPADVVESPPAATS